MDYLVHGDGHNLAEWDCNGAKIVKTEW
jgi:hypothetical protein